MWRPYGVAGAWRGSFGVYLATLTLCSTLAGWGSVALFQRGVGYADDWLAADQSARASDRGIVRQGFAALTPNWNERIRTNEFWSGRRKFEDEQTSIFQQICQSKHY